MFCMKIFVLDKYGNIFLVGFYTHLIFTVDPGIGVINSIINDNRNCV